MEAFAPPKSDSFAWSVVLGRLCTEHFLAQKGFIRAAENLDFHILRWRCRNGKSFAAALPKCLVSVHKNYRLVECLLGYTRFCRRVIPKLELFQPWWYAEKVWCLVLYSALYMVYLESQQWQIRFSIMLNHSGMDVFLWSFTGLLYGFHTNIGDHFVYMAIDLERNS